MHLARARKALEGGQEGGREGGRGGGREGRGGKNGIALSLSLFTIYMNHIWF